MIRVRGLSKRYAGGTAALDDVQAASAIELLTAQADSVGATLVVASHDARIRATFAHTFLLLPAA